MGVRSGDRGLELGCGVGFGAVALVSGGCNYVSGIDVNEQAIEAAGGALGSFLTGRNATVEVVVGNILNQSDCNFDVAMCIVGASHPTRHALELFRTSTVMRSLALLSHRAALLCSLAPSPSQVGFPIIADTTREIASLLGMLDADEVGVILADDNDPQWTSAAPGFGPLYWNAAAGSYAYLYGRGSVVGLDVLGNECRLRLAGDRPLLTDESNYIIDLHLNRIGYARHLAMVLNQIPGVVENGLFIDICDTVIIGHGDGRVMVRWAVNAVAKWTTFGSLNVTV
jgi:SAM-dependent methyltransferase